MKKIYLSLLILAITTLVTAQDYRLFTAESQKSFTTWPLPKRTFGLAFDSTVTSGNAELFYPYKGVAGYEISMSDSCLSMGGSGYCFPENVPSFAGSVITTTSSGSHYSFQTNEGISIELDLNLVPGQSVLFYEDTVQKFYFNGMTESLEDISGITDSVKNVLITHTDAEGNPINSALNNFVVKSGKVMGLINFFRIDSFPQIIQPVTLIGNMSPEAGLTTITNEELYNYQPGDEVQFHEQSINFTCHPLILFNRYTKLTYLRRIDEPDSIRYQCRREVFVVDSLTTVIDTIWTVWNKQTIVAQLPFDSNSHDELLSKKELTQIDYCGEPLWTFKKSFMHSGYCEESNCWGWADVPGIPLEDVETSVIGIGRYFKSLSQLIGDTTITYLFQVNYFRKGQLVCGDEQIVSTTDIMPEKGRLVIVPNPATDYIQIAGTELNSASVQVMDVNGKSLLNISTYSTGERINTVSLGRGIYLVRISNGAYVYTLKLIK